MTKFNFKNVHSLVVISLLVLLILLVGYGYFLFVIFETNTEQRILGEEAQLQSKREEHFRTIKKVLADTRSERLELNSRFISKDGVVSFIEKIESLSGITGASLDIRSVSIIDTDTTTEYEWLELSVDISGTWSELNHLVALVEHFPVALSLSGARIIYSNTDTDSGKEIWNGSFRVQAVKLKEN